MNRDESLSIILPAHNESLNIRTCIQNCLQVLQASPGEIIVVNDGSTDETEKIVQELQCEDARIRLFSHPNNYGYGAALRTGFHHAECEWIFFTDSDLQFQMSDLPVLLSHRDEYDVVLGFRAYRNDPAFRIWNAKMWGVLIRKLLQIEVQDINCAFKIFRRSVLDQIVMQSNGAFINAEILAQIAALNVPVKELPVQHLSRQYGEQSGAKPVVVMKAFYELMRLSWRLR